VKRITKLLTALAFCFLPMLASAGGKASHVVLIVWDGMRPDFVSAETTPTLMKLAQEGVRFAKHHAVYVSSTEVNGATLATGVYPGQNGIIGNEEFRPGIDPVKQFMTANFAAIRKADALSGNHYLGLPTLAEQLQRRGLRTVVAGTKPVALLLDRAARAEDSLGINLYEGHVLPELWSHQIKDRLGPFPPAARPKTKRDRWTTEALVGPFWDKGVPAFSLLWLSEPDYSQHGTGPGSPTSLAAIQGSDENLARVLAVLDQKQARADTDIIVVSDHGFSTICEKADVASILRGNGFQAATEFPAAGPRSGYILVVDNGGSVFLYLAGQDRKLLEKLVGFLQTQPFCGVLFTKERIEGTFSLDEARIQSSWAPDIVLAMRWKPDASTNGTPGLLYSGDATYRPGQGMHASLSPFDLGNICVAAGPDFRRGFADGLPTGNIDIVPTIFWLLSVESQEKLAGRVVREALVQSGSPPPPASLHHLKATSRNRDSVWRQYLDYSELEGVRYFERGNGEQVPSGRAGED
jgi:arylsulfatase A-like enzyme